MEENYGITVFEPGDTEEHEGVTYKAVLQESDEMCCEGCAFHKENGPCRCPVGWACVANVNDEMRDLIFKKVE